MLYTRNTHCKWTILQLNKILIKKKETLKDKRQESVRLETEQEGGGLTGHAHRAGSESSSRMRDFTPRGTVSPE